MLLCVLDATIVYHCVFRSFSCHNSVSLCTRQHNSMSLCVSDIATVCILEGFQKQGSLQQADRVLKSLGRARAKEAYKVRPLEIPLAMFICLIGFIVFCVDRSSGSKSLVPVLAVASTEQFSVFTEARV